MKHQGIIASDIDNTLTAKNHLIPDEVINYLTTLQKAGWILLFVTGRTFSFAYRSLDKFSVPYHLCMQHGAEILKMPEKKILHQLFVPMDIVKSLEEIYKDYESDFLLYAGFEKGDLCYYRPDRFTPKMQKYMEKLQTVAAKPWVTYESLDELEQKSFPMIKGVGEYHQMDEIRRKILKKHDLHVVVMRDVIDIDYSLLLINHPNVNKGRAVKGLIEEYGWQGLPVIAAGDDYNDIPLLGIGNVRIAMESHSSALNDLADIRGKSSEEHGIIDALEEAIRRIQS